MYYFFFSYARDNSAGGFLDTFYEDLKIEINQTTGIPVEEIGFRDSRSIPLGANWNVEIAEALRTCRTFVAVFSPAYFRSSCCGKEFEAFRLRLDPQVALENPCFIGWPLSPGGWLTIPWFLQDSPEVVSTALKKMNWARLFWNRSERLCFQQVRRSHAPR